MFYMKRKILVAASLMGALSIILGAFGAHSLKNSLSESQLNAFEIGVRYQMYHALFLLFIAETGILSDSAKKNIFWLVLIGVSFFSGSLYLLAIAEVVGISTKVIGPVTPLGGVLLISAWLIFFAKLLGKKAE